MRQALELALEALEYFQDTGTRPSDFAMSEDAIFAIKEALAQPEQEPQIAFNAEVIGYVAPQRTWVGLTDEERTEIRNKVQIYTSMDNIQYGLAIQHATETMLKEKNT